MKDRNLLLNIAIEPVTQCRRKRRIFVTVSLTIECWYTVCPSPKGLMTFWNQTS